MDNSGNSIGFRRNPALTMAKKQIGDHPRCHRCRHSQDEKYQEIGLIGVKSLTKSKARR
jgi:hypothetical protein